MMVSSLLLAITIVGCGKPSSSEPIVELQQIAEAEVSHEAELAESGTDEQEKSLEEKALLAYQEILKTSPAIEGEYAQLDDASFGYEENKALFGNHYELFALYDMNQDDIPELIAMSTVNFRWTPISIYTYADEEAVLLKNSSDMSSYCTFEQNSSANGAYVTYICEDNHIHSVWRGATPMGEEEENYAYALEGTSLTAVDCAAGENEKIVYFCDIAKANTPENVDAFYAPKLCRLEI